MKNNYQQLLVAHALTKNNKRQLTDNQVTIITAVIMLLGLIIAFIAI